MVSEDDKAVMRRLMEKRKAHGEAKAAEKKAKDEMDDAEADLYELLKDSGIVGAIKTDLGPPWGVRSFHTRETDYADVIDKEAYVQWLKDNGMLQSHTKPDVAKARANELVRRAKAAGEALPPGLSYRTQRGITAAGQKSG